MQKDKQQTEIFQICDEAFRMLELECRIRQHMIHQVQHGKTFSKLQKGKQRTKIFQIGSEACWMLELDGSSPQHMFFHVQLGKRGS